MCYIGLSDYGGHDVTERVRAETLLDLRASIQTPSGEQLVQELASSSFSATLPRQCISCPVANRLAASEPDCIEQKQRANCDSVDIKAAAINEAARTGYVSTRCLASYMGAKRPRLSPELPLLGSISVSFTFRISSTWPPSFRVRV